MHEKHRSNIATCLFGGVQLYVGVEKATCFKWLQNGDILRSPVQKWANHVATLSFGRGSKIG